MSALWRLSAEETAAQVRAGALKARDVAEAALSRLEAVNPQINAVVQRTDEEALAAAEAVDEAVKAGRDPGPLAGVPVTIKENVDQTGLPTTNGLRMQAGLIAQGDNPVVANLRRAGAVIVGRTNTPAFSLRWFTRNSLRGWTKNPWNPALTPGGSSGGAASATAAGIGAIGHGTDIAGSVRYPAYACGLHGIRPTQGRVAAFNGSSPDRHIGAQLMAVSGPKARSVADLRLAMEAMIAPDVRDPWHVPLPLAMGDFPRRAALSVNPEGLATTPQVEAALRDAAARLRDAGWDVAEAEAPPLREPARLQLRLWLAEMRRAGPIVEKEGDPDALHTFAEMERICPEPSLFDVMDALQARLSFLRQWQTFLADRPLLILPVSAEPPFPDQLDQTDFARCYEAMLPQCGLPLMGVPAASVFTGFCDMEAGRAPIGAQLVAPRFREDILLAAMAEIEARGEKPGIAEP